MLTKNNYLRDKTFYTNKTKVYEMDKIYSYDIDDKLDFEICENLYKIKEESWKIHDSSQIVDKTTKISMNVLMFWSFFKKK